MKKNAYDEFDINSEQIDRDDPMNPTPVAKTTDGKEQKMEQMVE